jgi:hypothetical protein
MNISLITKIILASGLRGRLKNLINAVIDIAIQEGKEEIDVADIFSEEEKATAKTGVDLLAARLKTLIEEKI